ncbi:tetratricopeptide repeat protein [uncultured Sphingomonas sp.]|uniref:tetratricopeptide repeat protein n=1 Tax=uncultured Sphingomonas sp. TaxID=158754 RepID=UPI0035CA854C
MRYLTLAVAVTATSAIGAPVVAGPPLHAQLESLARMGNAEAAYHLGMLAHTGTGGPRDAKKAFAWFTKAAAAGDPLGAYKVGCFYAGQGEGVVDVAPERALKYKLVAASTGYSLAQYDVGVHYAQQGRFSEALPWFMQAAEQGYPMSLFAVPSIAARPDMALKNAVQAYAYFKLSKVISEGRVSPGAQHQLDQFTKDLSAQQLAAAEQIVRTFQPRRLT